MLRVHPVLSTPDVRRAAEFLEALGLVPEPTTAPDRAVLDAGGGRVTVSRCDPGSPEDGHISPAFDVGDVREFARRTIEAGTAVHVSGEDPHVTAHVAAPGGTSFPARLGPRETGASASPLTVVARWHATALEATTRVLENIGAKPRGMQAPGGERVDRATTYRAKNGGLVTALAADRVSVELGFEYDGDVRDLLGRLTAAGLDPAVLEEPSGSAVHVQAPWGARLLIEGRPTDTGSR